VVDVTEAERAPSSARAGRPARAGRARREAGRPAVSLGRVDGLDGLRVLGALAVVVYHVVGSVQAANPPAMVILPPFAFAFFLISGFVIYRPFAAAHLTKRRMPPIGRFVVGRAIRVLPLWWLAVAVYLTVRGNPLQGTWDWIATLGLLQYAERDVRYAVIGPAWALSVEWIFYVSVPFLATGLWWLNRRLAPKVAPVRVQVAALAALAVPAMVFPAGRPFVAIIGGMALAVTDVHRRLAGVTPTWLLLLRRPSTAVVTTAVAWGLLVVYPYKEGLSVQWVEQDPLVVAIWIAVAVTWFAPVAFRAPSGPITTALAAPAMVRFSLLTFGIYLWHDLVLQETVDRLGTDAHLVAALYLTLLGALALAAFTFFTVERPLMVLKSTIDPPLGLCRAGRGAARSGRGAGRRRRGRRRAFERRRWHATAAPSSVASPAEARPSEARPRGGPASPPLPSRRPTRWRRHRRPPSPPRGPPPGAVGSPPSTGCG
jgi:peptidoglycan/LPS O-acetylase OafA/YrhL